MKRQINFRWLLCSIVLLMASSSQVWAADYYFASGTTIYIDFTGVNCNDKGGVNYPNSGSDNSLVYNASGCGTEITVTFSKQVKWSENTAFVKCQAGDWTNCSFTAPTSGQNVVKVASDGKSYTWETKGGGGGGGGCTNCKTVTNN